MKTEEGRADYKTAHPEGWVSPEGFPFQTGVIGMASLGEVTFSKIDQSGPVGADQFVYIDISSIDNKTKQITEPKMLAVSAAPSRAKQRLKAGDVLVSMTRPNLNAVAILPQKLDGAIGSTGFHVLRAGEGMEPHWLFYAVQTHNFISAMSELIQGALYPAVRPKDVRSFEIPIPPFKQQKAIVAEIEKQFSRLDEAVASLKRAKANLKRYKAAVLKAAVEGKFTEEWRKAHPDVEPASKLLERILAGRRRKWEEAELAKMKAKGKVPKDDKWKKGYKETLLPTVNQLPSLPNKWTFAGVEQLLPPEREAIKTGPFGSLLKKREHQPTGIPVLGIENIQAMRFIFGNKIFITSKKAKELSGYSVYSGDILISRSGTVGEVCVVPDNLGEARISTNLIKISLTKKGMLPEYFTLLFNGSPFVLEQISELCKGSTRSFLNQDILKRLVFTLPPYQEQKQIVNTVDSIISTIEKLGKDIERNISRAERLRQSILKKAFSGQLVPQNPEGEPASLLLEKIRERSHPGSEKRADKAAPIAKPAPRNGAKATLPISPAADSILNHMQPNREYSRAEIVDAIDLSVSQWNMAIRELKEQKKVRQSGKCRGATYSKTS